MKVCARSWSITWCSFCNKSRKSLKAGAPCHYVISQGTSFFKSSLNPITDWNHKNWKSQLQALTKLSSSTAASGLEAMESAFVWVWTVEVVYTWTRKIGRTMSIPSHTTLPSYASASTTESNRQPDGNAGLCRMSSWSQSFHGLNAPVQDAYKMLKSNIRRDGQVIRNILCICHVFHAMQCLVM